MLSPGILHARLLAGILASSPLARGEADPDPDLVRNPLGVRTFVDAGQLVQGRILDQEEVTGQFLQRSGIMLTAGATYKSDFEMRVSTGGMFWYSLPEMEGQPHTRLIKFGPGVGEVTAIKRLGGGADPWGRLQFGLFPYKYNPDAKNLGEYLLRSGTYPGYLWTGGWELINTAGYVGEGMRFSTSQLEGALKHEFTLFRERFIEPGYDLTASYLFGLTLGEGFQIGGGISYAHLLPVNPSKTTPRKRQNAYDVRTGMPLDIDEWQKPGYSLTDTMVVDPADPRKGRVVNCANGYCDTTLVPRASGGMDTVIRKDARDGERYVDAAENGVPLSELEYYTFRGAKVMGRFTFNPRAWMDIGWLGPDDLKLYGEAALLGIQDYPYYYDNRLERLPVMVGFNLPAFRVLDVLSLEVEYYKSRFPRDVQRAMVDAWPIWNLPKTGNTQPDPSEFDKSAWGGNRDFVKWSFYARKNVNKVLSFYAMAASDHTRAIKWSADPDFNPMTRKWDDWYWVMRMETSF